MFTPGDNFGSPPHFHLNIVYQAKKDGVNEPCGRLQVIDPAPKRSRTPSRRQLLRSTLALYQSRASSSTNAAFWRSGGHRGSLTCTVVQLLLQLGSRYRSHNGHHQASGCQSSLLSSRWHLRISLDLSLLKEFQ